MPAQNAFFGKVRKKIARYRKNGIAISNMTGAQKLPKLSIRKA